MGLGLEILVNMCITSSFSRQMSVSALESMGAEQTFRCHSFDIALKYKH